MTSTRVLIGVGAVAAALAAVAAVALLGGDSEATKGSGPVIAEANGVAIHQAHADARVAGITDVHGNIETTLGPDWRSFVLKTLVDDVIMRQEAERRGLVVTDSELESKVDDVKRQVGTAEEFELWLAESGMTEDELERRLDLQIIAGKVYEAVTSDAQPTEAEVRAFYEENIAQFSVDGEPRPFIEVKISIADSLADTMEQEAYTAWLEQQRAEAEVIVLDDDWK